MEVGPIIDATRMGAASSAAAIGQGNVAVTRPSSGANRFFGKPNPAADRYPMKADWRSADLSACVTYLEKLEAKIRAMEPRIVKVLAYMGSSVSDVMMYNSALIGTNVADSTSWVRFDEHDKIQEQGT